MKKKPFKLALVTVATILLAQSAQAQPETEAVICSMTGMEMTTLREPFYGAAGTVWDVIEGEEGMEVYADIIPLPEKNFIVAGTFTKDKEDKIYHPLLMQLNDLFKPVWETRDTAGPYKTIHRIAKTQEGYTVLGDIQDVEKGNGLYLGFYDAKGKFLKDTPVFEKGGNLDAKAMAFAADATGYLVAAQFIDGKNAARQYGLIYKFAPDGKQMWKRSYRPGRSSVFQNLQRTLTGDYLVTGQLVTDDNKSAGWVLRLDGKGVILWQQTYPRGLAASLQSASETKDGALILTGKIRPLSGTKHGLAAWVMKTDAAGNEVWQRYFRSPNYDFSADDAIVYEDGRASVLINGVGLSAEYRHHARLLTFSPQGQLQHLEEFTNGQNAVARRLVPGLDAERILAGYAQTSFGDNQDMDAPAPEYTFDGWMMAAVPLDLYEDPCTLPPPPSPILP